MTPAPYPCAAQPGRGLVHLDGPCRCFAGGPAPAFPQVPRLDEGEGAK
jgi:hypothetical protein